MPQTILSRENDHLSITIADDATAVITERATGRVWTMGRVALQEEGPIDVGHIWVRTTRSSCEEWGARFRVAAPGDAGGGVLRYTVLGRQRQDVGTFDVRVTLDGPWVEFRIVRVDERLPSLVFPTPIACASLVIPKGVGHWQRKPLGERKFWRFFSQLNMRFVGGLADDADHGYLAVITDGYNDGGVLFTEMAAMPAWLKSLGRWTGERAVRYRFTTGGYVGIAKAYRRWATERGLFVSLTEKMDRTPPLRNLLGGRLLGIYQGDTPHPDQRENMLRTPRPEEVAHAGRVHVRISHADAMAMVREARSLGMRRGIVNLRGWIKGGYDDSHPDVWPPEPAMGTTDELRALCALPDPTPLVLHDNYQDIYEQSASWPNGTLRTPAGDPLPGGFWAGGQAYIINARDGLHLARRNWEQIKTLGPRGMFIDTTTAVNMLESWEPGNELTRDQDERLKTDMLRFYKDQGLLLGSEESADFGIPQVDWLENRHARVAGESIPLWPLVFHDAVFCGRYRSPLDPEHKGTATPGWVTDMLFGYYNLWNIHGPDQWATAKAGFATTAPADDWHARTGAVEMRSHRYLTGDHEVEQTEYADGSAIVVNYATEERTVDGVTVKGGGYAIRG